MIAAIVLALTLFAQQAQVPIDCAIAYVGEPPVTVVVTVGGPGTDGEAEFCTERIATGNWVGVSNQGEWKDGLRPLAAMWPQGRPDILFNVWTSYDWQSRVFGAAFVEASRDPTNAVEIMYMSEP